MIEAVKKQVELCEKFIKDNIILGHTVTKDSYDLDVTVESIENIEVDSKRFVIDFKCKDLKGIETEVSYFSNSSTNNFNNNRKRVFSLQYNALKATIEYHKQKIEDYTQKIQQLEEECNRNEDTNCKA